MWYSVARAAKTGVRYASARSLTQADIHSRDRPARKKGRRAHVNGRRSHAMTMREDNGTGWERHVRVARAMMRRSGRLGPAGDAYVTSQEESKQTQRIETGIGRAPLLNAQTPANTSADPSLGGYCVLY